ncbi:unnamed protein product [Adineta steineri]|uniref:Uncharacterized protein n=2 Tax=Adineta steineri TaxID=433720 RepID=A0A813MIC2_9BILA|nr:unnamed protein product [Adineta steineri]CAF0724066.1 unnamed protein product [Adineta steineri]CAF3645725.1 unnamed protein product [Adineta steineri]
MSVTLLLICRRSLNLPHLSSGKSSLLRPLYFSSTIFSVQSSTLKSKYGSLKPASPDNPFREPTDEKSRRLKLQEHIRFREKFQLGNEYELIYAMPRQRMYSLMHLLCTCASITMFSFIAIHFYRDALDLEPLITATNQQIPPYIYDSIAAMIGTVFATVLFLISRMPVRLYYSPVRHSYALFYHPMIGVLRQKKILFNNNQYSIIPQKLDSIQSAERSIKLHIDFGQGLFRLKNNFYLIENYFRSKNDIHRIKTKDSQAEKTMNNEKEQTQEDESDMWQTVVERKDQPNNNNTQRSRQKKTFM